MPTWLSSKQIVLTKTMNGWAVSPDKTTSILECVTFDSWADLAYWLEANWGNPAP